jgi:hypothetical protein
LASGISFGLTGIISWLICIYTGNRNLFFAEEFRMGFKLKVFFTVFLSILIFSITFAGPSTLPNSPNGETVAIDTPLFSIEGNVLDENGKPIAGASVRLDGTHMGGPADEKGCFKISKIPGGKYDLSASAVGYHKSILHSLILPSDSSQTIVIPMIAADIKAETLWVNQLPSNVDNSLYTIEGTVFDENGKPIPFASVRIEGTKLGSAADDNGNFKIINVPYGLYDLSATAIGYNKNTIRCLEIPSDLSLATIIRLQSGTVEVEVHWVMKRAYVVDKYSTTNSWSANSEKLSASPARTINQALGACPGLSR